VYWFEVATLGRIAHGSMPFLGVSAISKMGDFIAAIEHQLKPMLTRKVTAMPVEPAEARRASININSISGGQPSGGFQTPCVADRCEAIFDRRFLIEEPVDEMEPAWVVMALAADLERLVEEPCLEAGLALHAAQDALVQGLVEARHRGHDRRPRLDHVGGQRVGALGVVDLRADRHRRNQGAPGS